MARMTERIEYAVIGAGISGLSTAFWLARQGGRVTVHEASARVGGSIRSIEQDGFRFEAGPNTVLDNRPEIAELLQAAGLLPRRITARAAAHKRFLWKAGQLHALPSGPLSFLRTPLFSARAKLRLLKEPFIARAPADREESIAQFVRRRLGGELLRYAVAPFVAGVYAGDPERLSVQHATRKIHALEREHGSLIRGALRKRSGPAPRAAMFSFPSGLDELPRALAQRIEELGGRVEISQPIDRLQALASDRIVLAVDAATAARLLMARDPRAAELAQVPYAAVVVISFGLRREQVRHPLDGFGFLVPRGEGLRILGCLFPSSLFDGRAPAGCVTLTCFLGGATDPEAMALDDAALRQLALGDIDRALGLRGEPLVHRLTRWPRAIPQYEVGHGRFVDLAQQLERDHLDLRIGGNYLHGVSVGDCIGTARQLARSLQR